MGYSVSLALIWDVLCLFFWYGLIRAVPWLWCWLGTCRSALMEYHSFVVSLSNIPPLLSSQSFSYLSQSDVIVHSCNLCLLVTFLIPSFQFGHLQYIYCSMDFLLLIAYHILSVHKMLNAKFNLGFPKQSAREFMYVTYVAEQKYLDN